MAGSILRLPQISFLLLIILQTSVVLSSRSGAPVILTTSDDGVLSKRFLQNRNNNNPNSGTCRTGMACEIQATANTLYTIVLQPRSEVLYYLDISYQTAMTLSFTSTSTSTQITSELVLVPYYGNYLQIDTPSNSSYSVVVSEGLIQEYENQDGQVQFLVANNSTGTTTTITVKMAFASAGSSSSGSGSSSTYTSSSGSGLSSSSSSTSDSGVSLVNIVLPIAGALFLIFLIGICCHYRKKQQEQQRVMAGHRARARRVRGDQQGDGEEEVEDLENLLTVGNIKERFPKAEFEHFKSSFPQTTCSVCLEEFQKGVGCRQLYCEHMFHSECIRLWLVNQLKKGYAFCPNCNKDMMRKPPELPQAVVQVKVQPRAIPGH